MEHFVEMKIAQREHFVIFSCVLFWLIVFLRKIKIAKMVVGSCLRRSNSKVYTLHKSAMHTIGNSSENGGFSFLGFAVWKFNFVEGFAVHVSMAKAV